MLVKQLVTKKTCVDYIMIQHVLISEAFVATELNKTFSGKQPRQECRSLKRQRTFTPWCGRLPEIILLKTCFIQKKSTSIYNNKNNNKSTKAINCTILKITHGYKMTYSTGFQTRRNYSSAENAVSSSTATCALTVL